MLRVEAHVLCDHQFFAAGLRRREHLLAFGGCAADRLFNNYVLARVQSIHGRINVHIVGRKHMNGVEFVHLQHLFVVGEDVRHVVLRCRLFCFLLHYVTDREYLYIRLLLERRQMREIGYEPAPYYAYIHRLQNRSSFLGWCSNYLVQSFGQEIPS